MDTHSSFDIVSLLLGGALGAGIAAAACARTVMAAHRRSAELEARLVSDEASHARARDHFQLLAQEALKGVQENFLVLAHEKLKSAQNDGAHDLEKRQTAISEMIKPLQKHLEVLGSTVEQIKGTDTQMREEMKNLTRETAKLAGALRDPTAQGRWGEYVLERLMENSGLTKGIHYETQVANSGAGQRPDAIVNLSEKLKIVIDAKTPLNEFTALLDQTMTEAESAQVMKNLAGQVSSHISALSKKNYWDNIDADSVDFTVLFLPSEQLFSMALRGDPGLAELAAAKNVIVASPTLMMALLRVIRMGWRQVDLADNAKAISEQGGQLFQRLSTFAGHLDKIGRGLDSALGGYNSAVGSFEKMVMPGARRLHEMGVPDGGKAIQDVKQIESVPKRLTGTDGG